MNIKEKIGQRIRDQRKAKGLTRKALAELTDDLKPSRISNWERGDRTPGSEEIKQLAKALDASASFLMCLSDDNKLAKAEIRKRVLIPLLNHQQACEYKEHLQRITDQYHANKDFMVPISNELAANLGEYAFALKMLDDSMIPDIMINDILIVDPMTSPKPGDYIAVKLKDKNEVIICQYRKLSYTSSEFELITLNINWPNINVNDSMHVDIIGTIIQNTRLYR